MKRRLCSILFLSLIIGFFLTPLLPSYASSDQTFYVTYHFIGPDGSNYGTLSETFSFPYQTYESGNTVYFHYNLISDIPLQFDVYSGRFNSTYYVYNNGYYDRAAMSDNNYWGGDEVHFELYVKYLLNGSKPSGFDIYYYVSSGGYMNLGSYPSDPTPTPVPTYNPPATSTPRPTNTPYPIVTNTPVPVATNTPVPVATNTPVPRATNTPVPVATNTPVPLATSTPVPSVPSDYFYFVGYDDGHAAFTSDVPSSYVWLIKTSLPVLSDNAYGPYYDRMVYYDLPTGITITSFSSGDVFLGNVFYIRIYYSSGRLAYEIHTYNGLGSPVIYFSSSLTPTPTITPRPTNTPVPVATSTPVPVATSTPVPKPTNTPVPVATSTPVPKPTNTPVPLPTLPPSNTPIPTFSPNVIPDINTDFGHGITFDDLTQLTQDMKNLSTLFVAPFEYLVSLSWDEWYLLWLIPIFSIIALFIWGNK